MMRWRFTEKAIVTRFKTEQKVIGCTDGLRILEIRRYAGCGKQFATTPQMNYIRSNINIEFSEAVHEHCPSCRQRLFGRKLAGLQHV